MAIKKLVQSTQKCGVSKKGRHNLALSGMDIVMQDIFLYSHSVKKKL
jgi:hypothetical protein